ncbi:hypothetical protein U1Q18_037895 [Sarracenia purpurea var. burkii]
MKTGPKTNMPVPADPAVRLRLKQKQVAGKLPPNPRQVKQAGPTRNDVNSAQESRLQAGTRPTLSMARESHLSTSLNRETQKTIDHSSIFFNTGATKNATLVLTPKASCSKINRNPRSNLKPEVKDHHGSLPGSGTSSQIGSHCRLKG